MIRVKLTLSYVGTQYHGWQIQNNATSVQDTLQKALSQLYHIPISVQGCSRTDTGVHAKLFVCHFDACESIPMVKLPLALNALLPGDISAQFAQIVPNTFHARFSCKGKTYCYRVHNSRLRNPFEEYRSFFWSYPLDAMLMHREAQAFLGEHDFSAFMASGSEMENTVRRIDRFSVDRIGDVIEFRVTGNGFLYNMVRIMVGTLIYASMGKLDRSLSEIIQSRDRTLAGITVPPQGLYLEEVHY